MSRYSDVIEVLKGRERLLIAGHEDPDCDCLGAALGLYLAAGGRERQWTLLRTGEPPKNLSYLPGLDLFRDPADISPADFDAVLLVDCSELTRAGDFLPALTGDKRVYCIDHHQVAQPEGEIAVVEPEAAAACEIISCILHEAGFAISDEAALCLYSGIASDTGGFRFRNTTPRCLTEAASLLPQIDSELVRIRLFEDRTYANMKMLAACLREMQVECGGLLAYSWLSHAEMEKYGAGYNDCHNIVNSLLELSGVKAALMFEEYADEVKMSFRCRDGYRVDELARRFDGGGHMLASGCKQPGGLSQVMPAVLEEARKLFC